MVLLRFPYQVAAAVAPGVHLADETEVAKHLQGAIDRHQSNARMFDAHPLVYLRRGEVADASEDDLEHRPALRGEAVAALPQH